MSSFKSQNLVVSNYVLHNTGLFHCTDSKKERITLSVNPASGGVPEISDGVLVFRTIKVKEQATSRQKIIFFAGNFEINPLLLKYLERFQCYGYFEGKLVPRHAKVALPVDTLDLNHPGIRARIFEDLSREHHNGEEDALIAHDDILIFDQPLCDHLNKLCQSLKNSEKTPEGVAWLQFLHDIEDFHPIASDVRLAEKIKNAACVSIVIDPSKCTDPSAFLEDIFCLMEKVTFLSICFLSYQGLKINPLASASIQRISNQLIECHLSCDDANDDFNELDSLLTCPIECIPPNASLLVWLNKMQITKEKESESPTLRNLKQLIVLNCTYTLSSVLSDLKNPKIEWLGVVDAVLPNAKSLNTFAVEDDSYGQYLRHLYGDTAAIYSDLRTSASCKNLRFLTLPFLTELNDEDLYDDSHCPWAWTHGIPQKLEFFHFGNSYDDNSIKGWEPKTAASFHASNMQIDVHHGRGTAMTGMENYTTNSLVLKIIDPWKDSFDAFKSYVKTFLDKITKKEIAKMTFLLCSTQSAEILNYIFTLSEESWSEGRGSLVEIKQDTQDTTDKKVKSLNYKVGGDATPSTPLKAEYVFINKDKDLIHPRQYLSIFFTLGQDLHLYSESLPSLSDLIEINTFLLQPSLIRSIEPKENNDYQGILDLLMISDCFYSLPGLVNQTLKTIRVPKHCSLHQNPNTGQYFIKSTKTQKVQILWLVHAFLPSNPKSLETTAPSPTFDLFSSLVFERDKATDALEISLDTDLEDSNLWAVETSQKDKIIHLAQWIRNFEPKNTKNSTDQFNDPIKHLNAIINRQAGRCAERAFLFHKLIQQLFPHLKSYYVENDLHAMVLIHFDGEPSLCFDLGGTPCHVTLDKRSDPAPSTDDTDDEQISMISIDLLKDVEEILSPKKSKSQDPFLNLLYPQEQTLDFDPKNPLQWMDALFFLFSKHSSKPKNILVTVDPSELPSVLDLLRETAKDQATQTLTDASSTPPCRLFVASSLASLRNKIYTKNSCDSTDTKLYLTTSPFAAFLASSARKILCIPGELLIDAPGACTYYPLLDSSRLINDLTLPSDLAVVILMPSGHLGRFREDFLSRFQKKVLLRVLLDDRASVMVDESPAPLTTPTGCSYNINPDGPAPFKALPINTYNFHTLFAHTEITEKGVTQNPGYLALGFQNIFVEGDLTREQSAKLSEAQSMFLPGDDYPFNIFTTPALEPSFHLQILEATVDSFYQLITQLITQCTGQVITLALPELSNPFVSNFLDDDGETKARLTELISCLQESNQTIILYGKLSPSLRATLSSIRAGYIFLAGKRFTVGSGTQVIILDQKKFPNTYAESAAASYLDDVSLDDVSLDDDAYCFPALLTEDTEHTADSLLEEAPEITLPFPTCPASCCTIRHTASNIFNKDLVAHWLQPWKERLQNWAAGTESVLQLSSFDLMNPASRSILRDLVHSAFTGSVLLNGRLIDLVATGKSIEVVGPLIPSQTKKLANAFFSYFSESADSDSSATITQKIIDPQEDIPLEDQERYDAVFKEHAMILTDSRRRLLHQLQLWLDSSSSHLHPLFLIEGPSGIGKSAISQHYLKETYPSMRIISPSNDLIQQLEQANREGLIVFIDEINTLQQDQLEAIEALVRSQANLRIIGTQNPISFSGRRRLSLDLLKHSVFFKLKEYSKEELVEIALRYVSSSIAPSLVEIFMKEQESHHANFRNFLSALTDWKDREKSKESTIATSCLSFASAVALRQEGQKQKGTKRSTPDTPDVVIEANVDEKYHRSA